MNREEKLRRIGYLFGMAEERLLYFAYTYLEAGNRDYAEDAIQQAFEKILRKVDELDFTNEDDIRNYLYKTVKHICFNINRYFRKFGCNDTQEERDIVMELMLVQEAEGDFVVCANELVELISGLQKKLCNSTSAEWCARSVYRADCKEDGNYRNNCKTIPHKSTQADEKEIQIG